MKIKAFLGNINKLGIAQTIGKDAKPDQLFCMDNPSREDTVNTVSRHATCPENRMAVYS